MAAMFDLLSCYVHWGKSEDEDRVWVEGWENVIHMS